MRAVILAGGKGTRLEPLNVVFPKPMVPLGNGAIIDIVIEQLRHYGFNEIVLSLGYLSELILAYIESRWGKEEGLNLRYVKEEKELGTVGSLGLISGLEGSFLVMNGDILTDLDYRKLYEFHRVKGGDLTVAMSRRVVKVDLGVMEVDEEQRVYNFIEKPRYEYQVSMGIYIYEPGVLKYLNGDERVDFPELVGWMLEDGKRVLGYESEDYWLDLGSHGDYRRAQEDFESMRDRILP